jgi:hypothetical protein
MMERKKKEKRKRKSTGELYVKIPSRGANNHEILP